MAVSCEAKCGKSILISFNLTHLLAGVAILVLGTSIFFDQSKLKVFNLVTFDSTDRSYGLYLGYSLFAIGISVFLVSWTGCCGAIKETRWLLVIYFILLFLLLLVNIGLSILTIIAREYWLDGLESRLRTHLLENYGNHTNNDNYLTFSETMDFVQHKFSCCGINNHTDYQFSKWRKKSPGFPDANRTFPEIHDKKFLNLIPLTCCVLKAAEEPQTSNAGSPISTGQREVLHGTVEELWQTPNVENEKRCQQPQNEEDLLLRQTKGCFHIIDEWFIRESTILIALGFSAGVLELFGMILTACLCQNLTDDI